MIELLLIVILASGFQCLVLEIFCRFQVGIVSLPRTALNLTKHYFALLPFVIFVVGYVKLTNYLVSSLGLSSLKGSLLLLGCVICYVIPVVYFMDYRYKGLVIKIEAWRKNT